MVEGKLHSRKQNRLESLEEVAKVMSIRLCDGCKQVLEEVDCEIPTSVFFRIQVVEKDK